MNVCNINYAQVAMTCDIFSSPTICAVTSLHQLSLHSANYLKYHQIYK